MARIRIGVSGWRYAPWRGVFYPRGLAQHAELRYLASKFDAVELNGSFYSLQRPENFAAWHDETPADFVFAVKGGRYITHMLRLRGVEQALANFFASGVFNLRAKLGPILWQFPPNFAYDPDRMRAFLDLLPGDTAQALWLARRRSAWMKGRTRLAVDGVRPMRHAIEIRHPSFLDASFIELLRRYNVALVVAETAGHWPLTFDVTADFVYMRLHGDKTLYQSGYGDAALDRWAERIRAWHRGAEPADAIHVSPQLPVGSVPRDVYCFFDNTDVKLRAPADARALARRLSAGPIHEPGVSIPMPMVARRTRRGRAAERPRAS